MTIDPTVLTATRTLAFLFTDIEGSTRLWERHPDGMRAALARHDRLLVSAVSDARGQVVKTTGDGIMAVFDTARDGVAACLAAQQGLFEADWAETGPLRVRMGLHVGEGSGDGSDYHGPAVNRAARIMAAGHGGQILLSGPTAALVMDQLPAGTALRDLGEHLLKDLARPERLYQLDYPSMPGAFEPLTTADVRLGSLPEEPSLFVGRETELATIVERLGDPEIRLLTLTGPGGIGKTRMALRAARVAGADFPAGAAFVDLSAARDTSAVLTAIARDLGIRDASKEDQLDDLAARIGTSRLLLVLDNVEQVTTAATTLVQLLQRCPALTILVTSREPLHVRGEHVIVVPPLDVPRAGPTPASAEQLGRFEAVLLFVERARALRPDFRLTDDNASVVADICRRLEGLPLAIELAVARLRVFSLEALRERLGSSLRVLSSGPRDLPERQQTLRATIDWSYQLLPPAEQQLFTLMACFAGADIEAVESVVAELGAWLRDDVEPIDGLPSLADKSLLRQLDRETGAPRFEMLESVREYALEQLETDPQRAREARTAHARYYAAWSADRAARLRGADRAEALRELEVEVDNLRAGWRCALDQRDVAAIEQLLAGIQRLYDARGWYRSLAAMAHEALGVVEALDRSAEVDALAISLRSDLARALMATEGYSEKVEAAVERLLASLEGTEVPEVYPVLRSLAAYYSFRDEPTRALAIGRRMVAMAERTGDPEMRVEGQLFVGTGRAFSEPLANGIAELETGRSWWQSRPYGLSFGRLGPDPRVSTSTALSLLYWWQGRLETSLLRSSEALELARELGHPSTSGYAYHHAALLHLWRDEPELARELSVRVIEVSDEHELTIWSAVGTVLRGVAAVYMGTSDEGLRWIGEGLERYRGLRTPPVFWPFLLHLKAEACRRAGDLAAGLEAVGEALVMEPQMPDLHLVHGDLARDGGDGGTAQAAYERAIGAAHAWGSGTPALRAATHLCRLEASSETERATRLVALRSVVDSLAEGLDSPDMVAARELLAAG